MRKVLKKVAPGIKVDEGEIKKVLENEVFKREILEGEKVEEARRKILKAFKLNNKKADKGPAL